MASLAKESLKRKRTQQGNDSDSEGDNSSKVAAAASKPYKQRVLVSSSRGISQRQRHLMSDILNILPHAKKGQFSSLSPFPSSPPLLSSLPLVVAPPPPFQPAHRYLETVS